MNKAIIKYKNGDTKEVKTKLSETKKIISFLKVIGEWNPDVVEIEIVKDVNFVSCNYQNMDSDM